MLTIGLERFTCKKCISKAKKEKIVSSQHKDKKFPNKEEFDRWLKNTTAYLINFVPQGQDVQRWWVDEIGEVLHSDFQAGVWNGTMINVSLLEETNKVVLADGKIINWEVAEVLPRSNWV
jgi:hypothetical protein